MALLSHLLDSNSNANGPLNQTWYREEQGRGGGSRNGGRASGRLKFGRQHAFGKHFASVCSQQTLKKREEAEEEEGSHRKDMHIGKRKWRTSSWTSRTLRVLLPAGSF